MGLVFMLKSGRFVEALKHICGKASKGSEVGVIFPRALKKIYTSPSLKQLTLTLFNSSACIHRHKSFSWLHPLPLKAQHPTMAIASTSCILTSWQFFGPADLEDRSHDSESVHVSQEPTGILAAGAVVIPFGLFQRAPAGKTFTSTLISLHCHGAVQAETYL